MSVSDKGEILGYVTSPDSELANEFNALQPDDEIGIFKVINLPKTVNNKARLLDELYRIHQLDWITSKRLDRNGNILPCTSSNCGGYTLEAEWELHLMVILNLIFRLGNKTIWCIKL